MSRPVDSRRLIEDSGSSRHLRKQIPSRTAKVKFIPIEKAVKMSSGAKNVQFHSRSKLRSSSVRIDTMETMSTRAPSEFNSSTPKTISQQKAKETFKSIPAGQFKLSGHGSEETSSTTRAQESKSCAGLKYKATLIEYKNQFLWKKESTDIPCINFLGGNLCADAEHKNSVIQRCRLVPSHPVFDSTWCGALEILDMVSCGQFCDGFRAHLPGKVHRKAIEYSRFMPRLLQCTLLPCCNAWAEIFEFESPTVNDMALFFSPGDVGRSRRQYFSLLELLEMRDMALKSLINGVNLLILSSKMLNLDSSGLEGQSSFLWGVYCPAKGHPAVPPKNMMQQRPSSLSQK